MPRTEAITVQAPLIDWDLGKHACCVDVWLRNEWTDRELGRRG